MVEYKDPAPEVGGEQAAVDPKAKGAENKGGGAQQDGEKEPDGGGEGGGARSKDDEGGKEEEEAEKEEEAPPAEAEDTEEKDDAVVDQEGKDGGERQSCQEPAEEEQKGAQGQADDDEQDSGSGAGATTQGEDNRSKEKKMPAANAVTGEEVKEGGGERAANKGEEKGSDEAGSEGYEGVEGQEVGVEKAVAEASEDKGRGGAEKAVKTVVDEAVGDEKDAVEAYKHDGGGEEEGKGKGEDDEVVEEVIDAPEYKIKGGEEGAGDAAPPQGPKGQKPPPQGAKNKPVFRPKTPMSPATSLGATVGLLPPVKEADEILRPRTAGSLLGPKTGGDAGLARSASTRPHARRVGSELSISVGRTRPNTPGSVTRNYTQTFSAFLSRQENQAQRRQAMIEHQQSISDRQRLVERGLLPGGKQPKIVKEDEFHEFLQRQDVVWAKKMKISAMGPQRITSDVVKPPPRMDGPEFQEFLTRQQGFAERTMTRCVLPNDNGPKTVVNQETMQAFLDRETKRHENFAAQCKKIEAEMWAAATVNYNRKPRILN